MSHVPHQAAGRKRHRYREQEVQRAVLEHLRWRGQRDAYWFHPPNGGWRSPAEARVFASLGVRAGTPDLVLIRRGVTYGLELKSATGKLSAAQCDAHEAMRRAGAICPHGSQSRRRCRMVGTAQLAERAGATVRRPGWLAPFLPGVSRGPDARRSNHRLPQP